MMRMCARHFIDPLAQTHSPILLKIRPKSISNCALFWCCELVFKQSNLKMDKSEEVPEYCQVMQVRGYLFS
jgi:hypothetical protein